MKNERSRRRKGRPTHVGEVVSAFLRRGEAKPRSAKVSKTARVFTCYETLGPPFTTKAEPTFFRGGVLTLVVEDPTWLTELSFLRDEMIGRLNDAMPDVKITEIRLRAGVLTRPTLKPPPARHAPPALNADQNRWLGEIESEVEDESLREIISKTARWLFRDKT